jgi:hypothetical protein
MTRQWEKGVLLHNAMGEKKLRKTFLEGNVAILFIT